MSEVWVWVEQKDGQVASVSWEALGLARRLADELGESAVALVFGPGAAQAGQQAVERGADRALICEDQTLSEYRVDPYASLLSKLAGERQPGFVIAGATTRGTDVLGAVSVDLRAGLLADVTDVTLDGGHVVATSPAFSGKLLATVTIPEPGDVPQLLTVRSRAFAAAEPDASRTGEVEAVEPVLAEDAVAVKVLGFEPAGGEVSLADAAIIVSGGRGVGGPEGFERRNWTVL